MNTGTKKIWFIMGLILIGLIISVWFFEKGESLGVILAK